ncbi:MAG: RecQ family ATP-dependent DNA helicase [Planctomycetes bacterium]|nr:RecQ family ATP-dependent DNA helicase [Planctomycetota bacterium]
MADEPAADGAPPGSPSDGTVALDLEIDHDGRLCSLGAVRGDERLELHGSDWRAAIAALDRFADGARFVVGHNLLWHDLPAIARRAPAARVTALPVVDTLVLSALAFPRRPYHHLVKDYKLVRSARNDPVADCRLALCVLNDAHEKLHQRPSWDLAILRAGFAPELRTELGAPLAAVAERPPAYGDSPGVSGGRSRDRCSDRGGIAAWLGQLGAPAIPLDDACRELVRQFGDRLCTSAAPALLAAQAACDPAPLAFVSAWLTADGTGSVLPAWVRAAFPAVTGLVRALRDEDCGSADCAWCRRVHSPDGQLRQWFGFEGFRAEPSDREGRSLQREIVAAGMRGQPTLGILPTGAGKSLCFQVPAIAGHARTGALTVVVSPLQALMKDQVDGFVARTGSTCGAALYGMLTPAERRDVVERVRLGEIGMLYVSPEQLRSPSVRRLLEGRQIRAWVYDEAHCVAKWGHDFRPDYLYVARFVRELAHAQGAPVPPIFALTATARADVRAEILEHFEAELGQRLGLFEAGVQRTNLHFAVEELPRYEKDDRIAALVEEVLATDGAVVVYCGTRRATEMLAATLTSRGIEAIAYHAGLQPGERRELQERFLQGQSRVVCATNAFGMGIDKDDVRLVVHAQMPGSLENYLQEAGRAGRDRKDARCVLLYTESDPEVQFGLLARSRLEKRDLAELLRAVRRRATARREEIVATAGELLRDDDIDTSIDPDERDATTRVTTAIAWLERARLLQRDDNRTAAISAQPLVRSLSEAEQIIAGRGLSEQRAEIWREVLAHLLNADPSRPVDTDELAGLPRLRDWEQQARAAPDRGGRQPSANVEVLRILHEMACKGLVDESVRITAFLRHGIADSSKTRLERARVLDTAMLDRLRESLPDPEPDAWYPLSLRHLNQSLRDAGFESDVGQLRKLLQSVERDGRGAAGSDGSLQRRHEGGDMWRVRLRRPWDALIATARLRCDVAGVVLRHLIERIPEGTPPGKDILVKSSLEALHDALGRDMFQRLDVRDPFAAIDRALLFLHEQDVIVLQGGLAVFRRAMTIRLGERRRFTADDYRPLHDHYEEQIRSVHVMARYAELGATSMADAAALVGDYFTLSGPAFRRRHFPGANGALSRQTTRASHERIVTALGDQRQQRVVTAEADRSMLVLAGPGAGKTRVVVHRCAWLLRATRAPARSILLVCFNRATAAELRRRLVDLVGTDAFGVAIGTYHALAARLLGRSFAGRGADQPVTDDELDALIPQAAALLRGEAQTRGGDPDEERDRLLAGFRHILVDEYQDIDAAQYELLSALAGRTEDDPDRRCTLLAVGDDDQAIYGFRGASVEFIRRFTDDYRAERHELTANYRSTRAIVTAANAIIEPGVGRMKTQSLHVDEVRAADAWGGPAAALDPATAGCVQVLEVAAPSGDGRDATPRHRAAQAVAVVDELLRQRALLPAAAPWSTFAVLAYGRPDLLPVRALCEERGIPLCWGDDLAGVRTAAVREVATFLDVIAELASRNAEVDAHVLAACRVEAHARAGDPDSPWWAAVGELIDGWRATHGDHAASARSFELFALEALAEDRRRRGPRNGVQIRTIHGAKGLEFERVFLLDGGFHGGELEQQRRLYYVGATRARDALCAVQRADERNPFVALLRGEQVVRRAVAVAPERLPGARAVTDFVLLGLDEVFLDFAGRRPAHDPVHAALADLRVGTSLRAVAAGDHVRFLAPSGTPVVELSKRGVQRYAGRLADVESVRVVALLVRRRAECARDFEDACAVDRWLLPLCELALRDRAIASSNGA